MTKRAFSSCRAVIMLLAVSCASTGESQTKSARPVPDLLKHELTGKFGACGMDCSFDFRELEAGEPRIVQTYCRDAEPSCIEFEGVLTGQATAQLKAIGRELASVELQEHYGCGKCYDGSDTTIVLARSDGRVTRHSFDSSHERTDEPKLDPAHALLTRLHQAFYACKSNELIKMKSCTPYMQLSPRPYSRP